MSEYEGHCNCNNIVVSLPEKPSELLACHCFNCRRAGGPFSVNYAIPEEKVKIIDKKGALRQYKDTNTDSGNLVNRSFCGQCGSAVVTQSPKFPGTLLVKANLFEDVADITGQVYKEKKLGWINFTKDI